MFKELAKKIVYGQKYDSESYIKYLRKIGVRIGNDCTIYVPRKTTIDEQNPFLIDIGNHVRITQGVTILTHGYDWSVLKGVYGDVLGSCGKVKIGNNVFIGMNSTILKGVTIGDNVIIGAGSLVTSNIENNCVAAGNPCKKIMTIDDYHKKRINAQVKEAKQLVEEYRKVYKCDPNSETLREFFWLFANGDDIIPSSWNDVLKLCENYSFTTSIFNKNEKNYENLEDFLKSI
ncbi:MAG: acyltransferase [Amedibacillus dolichus]|uniref:Acyltransferase n=1 Tax=Amedibacillus dolichus TaxID=31971 RepID=A0A943A3E6_9FIRM|nr:acyltransferase [Amedibacillus dolichus]MBS4884440.1 acyltransferase [Amedibacillus dolichus]